MTVELRSLFLLVYRKPGFEVVQKVKLKGNYYINRKY
jgi:hypothetical protein